MFDFSCPHNCVTDPFSVLLIQDLSVKTENMLWMLGEKGWCYSYFLKKCTFFKNVLKTDMRAATSLQYLNVNCCTSTCRTNQVTVASNSQTTWECKCKIVMHENFIYFKFITSRVKPQGKHHTSIQSHFSLSF